MTLRNRVCAGIISSALLAIPAVAGDYLGGLYSEKSAPVNEVVVPEDYHLFEAGEIHLDLAYLTIDGDNFNSEPGYGFGLSYYFTRHLGVMVEGFHFEDLPGNDFNITANALVRIPVDQVALAFYGFAGGGYHFGEDDQFSLQIGGGVEARLTDGLSAFFDARFAEPEATDNSFSIYRLGLRFIF